MEIREEQVVLRRQRAGGEAIGSRRVRDDRWATDGGSERVEPSDIHVLPVAPLVVAVERTHQPVQPIPTTGQAHLLGPHDGVRVVIERRIECVDILGKPESPAGDTARQGSRIAHDQDVAVRVRRDRRQRSRPEIDLQVDVAQQELIGNGFLDLREQLPRTERHLRSGRRIRIGEDVESIDAIPSVRLRALIDQPWSDAETTRGGEPERGAQTGPVVAVDVLVNSQIRLHCVHVPASARAIAHDPERGLITNWRIEAELCNAARVAAVDGGHAHLAKRATVAELRLIADVAHRAGQRARAEQRALRTAQHLDPADVEQVEIRREQR